MTGHKDDGGPAFPVPEASASNVVNGMSLRDWFAGQALQGMLAQDGAGMLRSEYDAFALDSYLFADAMLKARGKL